MDWHSFVSRLEGMGDEDGKDEQSSKRVCTENSSQIVDDLVGIDHYVTILIDCF